MIKEKIDELIASAMKSHDESSLRTYRLIKTELVKAEKTGKSVDTVMEMTILNKMKNQRKESYEIYKQQGRDSLAENEMSELVIIEGLLPKPLSEEEIKNNVVSAVNEYVKSKGDNYILSMKDMKPILSEVQKDHPEIDGKTVSKILQEEIKRR